MAEGALPEAPVWSDARTFDGRPWRGKVAGVVAGYPCQPFSAAGKRRGSNDSRHLWPAIERIVEEVRPAWCFFENVDGHLRIGYFDVVRPQLEALGFLCKEQIVSASDVGAPHQRKRLFILAVEDANRIDCDGGGIQAEIRCSCGSRPAHSYQRSGAMVDSSHFPPGRNAPEGRWAGISEWYWPSVEPAIRRMAYGPAGGLGLSYADQLRLLGNAVVPDQAALAWRILWQVI